MKTINFTFALIVTVIATGISIFGQTGSKISTVKNDEAPDLVIKKYAFVKMSDKALRVYVFNQGKVAAGANRLQLTVGEIDGVSVARKKIFTVPVLENDTGAWLFLNAKSILPDDVPLKSTVFRLTIDATKIVEESDESNNDFYHTGKDAPLVPSDIESLQPEISAAASDLRIRQIRFDEKDKNLVEVQVYNAGNADADATRFLLAISNIENTEVNRRKRYKMPPLGIGKAVWITLDADSLLPEDVSLKSTTFRVSVDIPDIIDEPDEKNNHYYHKP